MVKININLRSKNTLLYLSGCVVIFMLYNINLTSKEFNLTALDLLTFFGLAIFAATLWFIPFQFNEHFT